MKHLLDYIPASVRDAICEPEPITSSTSKKSISSAPAPSTAAAPAPMPTLNSTLGANYGFTAATPGFGTPTVVLDEGVYKKLLTKTDFEATTVAKTIHKYMDAMSAVPMSAEQKFTIAVGQAKTIDKLTNEEILAAFDSLKSALQAEQDVFNKHAQDYIASDVTARQNQLTDIGNKIAALTREITELQSQSADVQNRLIAAQANANGAQTQFNLAVQRRANEIEQQKNQFAQMLK
jgi:hypothetical protein